MQEPSENGQWSVFSSALDELLKPLRTENDVRIIRDLAEINIQLSDYELGDEVPTLKFPAPSTAAETRILCESLLRLSAYTKRLTKDLLSGANLKSSQKQYLDLVRRNLIELLTDYPRETTIRHTFQLANIDRAFRLDTFLFFTTLQCLCCLVQDQNIFDGLARRTCSSPSLARLVEEKIVPRNLHTQQILAFRLPDIMSCLKWLESHWNTMPYLDCLWEYLDLLMIRLSVICVLPQDEIIYGQIQDYKQPLDDGRFTHTQRLIEDTCWTFVPMFKKLALCKRVGSERQAGLEIASGVKHKLQDLVVQNAFDMGNKEMIDIFFKTYMKCRLRPSEKAKFQRDYPSKAFAVPTVIEKLRGVASKKTIMERLARSPWIIVREKLFDKVTTEILYILLLDSFVSNITGLRWMNTFVEFNVQLMKVPDVVHHLDRTYPRIVQDFNHFNLLHKGVLYTHNSAAKSYLHWLKIMLAPPFRGRFNGKTLEVLSHYTN